MAQGSQIRGKVLRAMPGIVLMEGYVQHVVQAVLDAPVSADEARDLFSVALRIAPDVVGGFHG